jgi:hypothetical protein
MPDDVTASRKRPQIYFSRPVSSRAARFFLVQHAKMGDNITNDHKIYQMVNKIYQSAVKYTDIFPCKTLQNLPKLGFWV